MEIITYLSKFRLAYLVPPVLSCLFMLAACTSINNRALISEFEQGGLTAEETSQGVVIYLPRLMFDFGSANLSDTAESKVEFVSRVINKPIAGNRELLIEGHTDAIGSDDSNFALSEERANSVSLLLQQFGVNEARIQNNWFGELQPVMLNTFSDGSDNPEGRAANRRVMLILLNP